MTDMPETILARPVMGVEYSDGTATSGPWSQKNPFGNATQYTRADLSDAMVAAAYEAAAQQVFNQHPADCQAAIRALTPDDARAALDAAIDRAVTAERKRCARLAYIACAETRHVTLGDKVHSAILDGETK